MKAVVFFLLALFSVQLVSAKTQVGSTTCAVCEYLVGLAEGYVTTNTTEQEFIQKLDKACGLFPAFAPVCDQMIQFGVAELFAYIQADLTPSQACTLMKLCTSNSQDAPIPEPAVISIEAPVDVESPAGGDGCATCERVVGIVKAVASNNATTNEIIDALKTTCALIPPLSTVCNQLMPEIELVIQLLKANVSSQSICTMLKLCPASPEVIEPVQTQAVICPACEYAVGLIESWVEENATVSEIETKLQKVCNLVPGLGPICTSFLNYGIQDIISYINADLTPTQVCVILKLCTPQATVGMVRPESTLNLGAGCNICKYVVGLVEEWLAQPTTVAEVTGYVKSMCTHVGGLDAMCEQVVEFGVAEFVQYVETNELPATFCEQVHLCAVPRCPKFAVQQ
jgi:hypothetical protein